MRCPYCRSTNNKVIDSRPSREANAIRRRPGGNASTATGASPLMNRWKRPCPSSSKTSAGNPFERSKVYKGVAGALRKAPRFHRRHRKLPGRLGTGDAGERHAGNRLHLDRRTGHGAAQAVGRSGLRQICLGLPPLHRRHRLHGRNPPPPGQPEGREGRIKYSHHRDTKDTEKNDLKWRGKPVTLKNISIYLCESLCPFVPLW